MKLFILLLAISSFQVLAQDHHHGHAHHAQKSAQRKPLGEKDKKILTDALKINDQLFNALLAKDTKLIEKKSQEISDLFQGNKEAIYKELTSKAGNLKKIKSSTKQEDALKAYEEFLKPLIKVVQEYDIENSYNVFSCPMVKKSWIQDVRVNKGVKNVFAPYMLECGTQDTHF